ncbi:hypothetical protein HK405_000760, partial [Cladochytrium tenue]
DYECHTACPTGSDYYCSSGSVCLADGICSSSGGGGGAGGDGGSALSTGAIIGIAVAACVVVAAVVVAAVIFFRSRPSRSDNTAAKLDQTYQQNYATPGPGGPPAAPSIVDMSSRVRPPSVAVTPQSQLQSPPASSGPFSDFSYPPDTTLRQLPGSAAAHYAAAPLPVVPAFTPPDSDNASTAATSHASYASHSDAAAAAVPAHQLPKVQGVP